MKENKTVAIKVISNKLSYKLCTLEEIRCLWLSLVFFAEKELHTLLCSKMSRKFFLKKRCMLHDILILDLDFLFDEASII